MQALRSGAEDYTLFLDKLKEMALKGENREECLRALGREEIWPRLDKEKLLELSGMAQMLGEIDLGLRILEKAHELYPDYVRAWREHMDVLAILGRKKECIALRSRARECGAGDIDPDIAAPDAPGAGLDTDGPDEECLDPFVQNRKKEELLSLYMDMFQGREDCFARQWADKTNGKQGYVPVRRAIRKEDVLKHLQGARTHGLYLLDTNNRVSLSVLDADLDKKVRQTGLSGSVRAGIKRERDYMLRRLQEISREKIGVLPLKEFSGGKGYHFWFFFSRPVQAGLARRMLGILVGQLAGDLEFFNLEVFPKQDRLQGKGLGNLVKYPLGVHRLSGRPSYFDAANRGDAWRDMPKLKQVVRIDPEGLSEIMDAGRSAKVSVHPREEKWAEKYPELHELGVKCPLLGSVFVRARQGRELSMREEKIVLQTVGFMRRANTLVHAILCRAAEYNPHLVDYKLSRLRGTPLGCKKIHQLLNSTRDFCEFENPRPYAHPLIHCPEHVPENGAEAEGERAGNLRDALEDLRKSLDTVQVFLNKNT